MRNANKHLIAAIAAIIFTAGIWIGDMVYDRYNTKAVKLCGDGNVKQVINKGLFKTEVTCRRAR